MKTVIIGAALNIVLDPVFIFAFGMGVERISLLKYNIPNLPIDNPLSVTYAFNERCKMIPQSVSLAYFVKVLCTQDPIKANKLHLQSFLLT